MAAAPQAVCVCEIVVRTDVILRTRDDDADDGDDDDDELLKTNIIFNQFSVFGVFELVNGLFIHTFIRFPFIYNIHPHTHTCIVAVETDAIRKSVVILLHHLLLLLLSCLGFVSWRPRQSQWN